MNKVFGSRSSKNIRPSFLPVHFGARALLLASSTTLILALLGWYSLHSSAWRWLPPYAFVVVTFFAPALAILACLDSHRNGWSPSRILALVISSAAFTTPVAIMHHVFQHM
jgi:hypothetical protein